MADSKDYYEILGVERDADQRTIKRAFLKRAREVHPDVSDAPDAEERFKELNEAYSVLSDEEKRAMYDRYGSAAGPGMGSGYVDISDIFGGMGMEDIFSSFFGGGTGGGRAQQARTRGRDMSIHVSITLEEAALGTTKTISFDRMAPCDDCNGSGLAEGAQEEDCSRCHGSGFVTQVQRSIFGQVQSSAPCPDCHGEGRIIDHPCEMCQGQGRTPSHETIDVHIPAGIGSGRQLRVQDFGEAGYRGAASGDLLVSVEVEAHERFQRRGNDLYLEQRISMVQAALGTTLELPGIMPDEMVTVEVPAGSQFGDLITVNEKGMPRMGGGGSRGRFIVSLAIEIPRTLSAEERELLEKLAQLAQTPVNTKRSVGEYIRDTIDDIFND
ncbi:molecular chaperone DnaJ [Collinsella sp. zg1085]|uniref:molecular chaperone DnaJ n=1 Tax=Collinsella sp. zg1085 TaxID=2844380 RepID=UPI001C0DFCB8|nr:molecular chaperone DnaJ [Collinsella sp. zg1085]QWT16979.1 molecular chaperone DnaJ [Collinsella sp. zg1085]